MQIRSRLDLLLARIMISHSKGFPVSFVAPILGTAVPYHRVAAYYPTIFHNNDIRKTKNVNIVI